MTEAQWLRCETLAPLLVHLRGAGDAAAHRRLVVPGGTLVAGPCERISARKLRLFVLACCRRLLRLPLDRGSLEVVAAVGRYAEGKIARGEFVAACVDLAKTQPQPARRAALSASDAILWSEDVIGAFRAAREVSGVFASRSVPEALIVLDTMATVPEEWLPFSEGLPDVHWRRARDLEEQEQAGLLRHIIGNPFRPVAVDPAWLEANDGVARKIARVIDDEQRYDELPFLADALEDAGCTNTDLHDHCRGPGPHFRGCWAVDLLLWAGGALRS
jgi:hypothetical protein